MHAWRYKSQATAEDFTRQLRLVAGFVAARVFAMAGALGSQPGACKTRMRWRAQSYNTRRGSQDGAIVHGE